MKVALVCDWLTNVGGAEKVLLEFHRLYPEAPIYTSKYSKRGIDWFADADVRTGWLQIFPARVRRLLGPLRMRWFRKLDLSEYDLVISVTGAEAKAVGALKPGARHICYCHAPTQYYWQMYDEYVEDYFLSDDYEENDEDDDSNKDKKENEITSAMGLF